MNPLHLILDSCAHPGIAMFWKRYGLRVMEQLVPHHFTTTSKELPLGQVMEDEVQVGCKKIILIGTPDSIMEGFNILMSAKREIRATLEIGFWSLSIQELATNIFHSSDYLEASLQVFKAGNTLAVDVMKVQYLTSKLMTYYVWGETYVQNSVPTASTSIFIDEQDHRFEGKLNCKIVFHEEPLNSLLAHPGRLKRSSVLQIYMDWKQEFVVKDWIYKQLNLTAKETEETLLKTGKMVEIQGNWTNLRLNDPRMKDTVQTVHFSVEHKAFSLIIPAKPIQVHESSVEFVPNFLKPGTLTSSRHQSPNTWFQDQD